MELGVVTAVCWLAKGLTFSPVPPSPSLSLCLVNLIKRLLLGAEDEGRPKERKKHEEGIPAFQNMHCQAFSCPFTTTKLTHRPVCSTDLYLLGEGKDHWIWLSQRRLPKDGEIRLQVQAQTSTENNHAANKGWLAVYFVKQHVQSYTRTSQRHGHCPTQFCAIPLVSFGLPHSSYHHLVDVYLYALFLSPHDKLNNAGSTLFSLLFSMPSSGALI